MAKTSSACEQYDAIRIDIWEKPLGPMPGFPHRIPRCVVNIRIPDGYLDDTALLKIAVEQKTRVLSFGKQYCAMAFHFWTRRQMVEKDTDGNRRYLHEAAAAVIDYAPGGKWEDALDAPIGDYGKHKFQVMHNRTKEE